MGTALLCAVVSVFSRLLLLPFIALTAYMASQWGILFLLPPAAGLAIGITAAFGLDSSSIPMLAFLVLSAAFLTAYGKKRFPHRYCALGLAVIITLGIYLSLALGSILAGDPPHTEAARIWSEVWEAAVPSSLSESAAEEFRDIGARTALLLPDVLMWISVMLGEALSIALIFLFRLCHRIFRTEPQKMARFADWRLPKSAIPGGIILLLGIGLAYILKLDGANAVAYALGFIVASLFSVQGLAYLFFALETSKAPGSVKTVLCVFCGLTFPYCMAFLSFIGVREQIQKRRRAITDYLKSISKVTEFEKRSNELAKYGYIREDLPKHEKKDAAPRESGDGDDNGPRGESSAADNKEDR
ncbi:MAG: DUF2232 domain-containing protein [Clostridia bacterium]|nr:DUF2232 domain-containing protein [Clostridia bacterium]